MGGVGAAIGGRGAGAEPTRGAARRLAAGAAAGGAGLRLHTSGTLCTLQCISSLEGHTGTECRQAWRDTQAPSAGSAGWPRGSIDCQLLFGDGRQLRGITIPSYPPVNSVTGEQRRRSGPMPWGQPVAVACAGFQVRGEGPGGGGGGGAAAVPGAVAQARHAAGGPGSGLPTNSSSRIAPHRTQILEEALSCRLVICFLCVSIMRQRPAGAAVHV